MANARDHSKKSLIDQAKEYVHNNYSNEALNLDDICSELGVSNSYFSSIFKKEVGISFITYLTDYRMQQAVHLMLDCAFHQVLCVANFILTHSHFISIVKQ